MSYDNELCEQYSNGYKAGMRPTNREHLEELGIYLDELENFLALIIEAESYGDNKEARQLYDDAADFLNKRFTPRELDALGGVLYAHGQTYSK